MPSENAVVQCFSFAVVFAGRLAGVIPGSSRPVPEGDSSGCANSCSVTGLLHGTCVPAPQLRKEMAMAIVDSARSVVGGVDTHLDEHVAAVVDAVGGVLGVERFPVTPAGYRRMLAWMRSFGQLERVGVEGTGSYGVGLARFLLSSGLVVLEVTRPNRQDG
jgi:hypothetical protein